TIAKDIGVHQSAIGTTFYDPQREAYMLTQLEMNNKGPFSNEVIKALFKEIFRASMALEEKEARAKLLVQRKTAQDRTIVELPDGTKIGDGSFQLVAGSCA
ncbi:MAG TPA: chorismate mutase, partial [Aggregatilineales bacterium]|nr:chorismate mutase [Aggregatilineales bacterium]